MKKNAPHSSLRRPRFYLTIAALVAMSALASFLLSNKPVAVSAQGNDEKPRATKVATPAMLTLALNFGAAADYSVFADKGVAKGNSRLVGKRMRAGVAENNEVGTRVLKGGPIKTQNDIAAAKAHKDLSNAFAVLQNLPCTETNAEMRNGNFKAGVYCASSGDLKGEFVLDGFGDPNSIFIFRSDGKISTQSDFKITLASGAAARNVFFVSGDSVNIGPGINLNGNIVARDAIRVAEGSTVNGRALSVDGKVEASEAAIVATTGVLQICKTAFGGGLDDRIFRFQIGSEIILVPVGSCSGPITLPEGPVVIDELIDGPLIPSGSFSGRFRLLAVGTDPADALIDENLPTRRVTINVRPGNIQNQTVVEFINVFAVNALVNICKYPGQDVDAAGTTVVPTVDPVTGDSAIRDRDVVAGTPFEFTIDLVLDTVFTVPVGGCSPPIQVNAPATAGPAPVETQIIVTELAQVNSFGDPIYRLDGDPPTLAASTIPADRHNGTSFSIGLDNSNTFGFPPFFNPGGGVVGVDVLEGGAAEQTTVNFFNRSEPGYVKVCKVAGPGIPIGTRFEFTINGKEPSDTPRTTFEAEPPFTVPSFPFPGAILPGVDTTRTLTVPAGPAPLGFCEFVRFGSPDPAGGRVKYIAGSQVLITENPVPLDPVPGVPPGVVQVSKIRLDAGAGTFASPAKIIHSAVNGGAEYTLDPNPDLAGRQAIFRARRGNVEVEFTDYVFTTTTNQGVGLYYNSSAVFLKNDPTFGPADFTFSFGTSSINNHKAIAGDWNNDGVDTIGLYDPGTGNFFLTDVNYSGAASSTFQFGASNQGYLPVAGDWDGDGDDTIGVYDPATGTFFLRNSNSAGVADVVVSFGPGGANIVPIAGDWDGDGDDTVGIYDSNTGFFFLKNSNTPGSADLTFSFGTGGGSLPVVGDWDGNGTDTIGIYLPSGGVFFLRNSNTAGPADIPPFTFGAGGGQPIAGDWAP